jgi:diguanylate cyclase (GGDEF)-like protein/PAS domain S-box-containing protein
MDSGFAPWARPGMTTETSGTVVLGIRGDASGVGVKRYRPHILVACVLAIVLLAGINRVLQNGLTDMRFGWSPRQASGDIVLVAIDSRSIEAIGIWPWPRQKHADLIGQLERAGATDIVFDVDFSSPSNPAADEAFAEALKKAGGSVVLPAFKQWTANGQRGKTLYLNRPLPQFDPYAWSAIVNVAVEPDGLVRRYSFGETLGDKFLPSVGALLAGKYDSNEPPLRIDFSIAAASLPAVSYIDVLRGDPAALKIIKGKKVIIGATAIELGDRFSVPNGHVIPGPQLQMLAAESILQGRALRSVSRLSTLGGLGLLLILMVALWRRVSAIRRVLILVGISVFAEICAVVLQAQFAVVLDTSLWHCAVIAYLAAMALDEIDFHSLLGGIAEKRFQKIAMSLGDGLVCIDHRGLITVWNPGAAAIFGYRADEMLGHPFERIFASTVKTKAGAPLSLQDLPVGDSQGSNGTVMELEGRRNGGESFPLEACFSKWQGVEGFQYGAVIRDISDRKREAQRIKYLAEHDTLTGLANRNTLHEHLAKMLAEADEARSKVALVMLDLDKFKQVNDTLGHACGDQLLCAVAKRLDSLAEGNGLVARLSGDEFAIVVSGAGAEERAIKLSEQISVAFGNIPFVVGERQLRVNASIGVAVYPENCASADELFGNADLALYRAKFAGRGRTVAFEQSIRDELEQRVALEAELKRALDRKELELFYQPQVSLEDGRLMGAETLIRWRHPSRGLIPPADFMPLVHASSQSGRIAAWVLETACRQGEKWQRIGHGVRLGVNLSPAQLQSGDLAEAVASKLRETGLSPSLLELEVTENIVLEDDQAALEIFRRIRELGVHIAFDDFGTGYASLSYLKKFPLDRLKIDKSFVSDIRQNSGDAAIVTTIIGLGRSLGLSVIAEGIEDRDTAELLRRMGCQQAQGYHFGQPMPAAEFEQKCLRSATSATAA